MAYDIYTYGNGEVLTGLFNAIAMCLNSQTGSLFQSFKTLGLLIGAFWALLYAVYGDQIKAFTHWIIPSVILLNGLFIPTASVWVHDPVTNYHQKVDHVPYGLAVFAGYVSKIGYLMTEQVEKIFTLPDDLRYQKTGTLFASNLILQARTFHISNGDVAENMRSFVGQCVIYDAALGRKYSLDDLRKTDDIWGLVSENASPVRSFLWREPKAEGQARALPEIITCQAGVQKFNALWAGEIDRSANLFGKKIFGNNGLVSAKAELLKHLPLAYSTLGNIAKNATDILKQQMMIYAVVDGFENRSTAVGNAPNFAARRAYLQQRATYETLGAMVGETLPTMKAVLEAIAYGCFIFMLPLAMLPFGWQFLMRWAQIILWLQMWAPLYAILNYVMTMAAKGKTMAALSISNEAGVTIASSIGVANMNTDIQAMAGYLAMSIPFLSIAIIKGVGSFVHMSSHLGNISQSAAGAAASEVTTGNLSYGNISEGNTQIANTSMLNHNRSAGYKTGAFQFQDGRSDITTMADGSQIAQIGNSNLPISVNAADSISAQQSEMATRAYQKGMTLSESSGENLSSASRSAVQLSETLGKMESSGDSASMNISTEQSQAIHKGANLVKDFAKQHNVSDEKAASLLGEASAGIGLGKNSLGMSGKGSLNAQEQALYQKAEKFAEDHNYQQAMRDATQASKQISHNTSHETAKRLAEDVSGSFEQGMSQRSEASKSFNESESYSRQAMLTQTNAATINRNASQEFVEWMADQPAENAPGRMGSHEAARLVATQPEKTMAYAQRFMQEKGLVKNQELGMSASAMKQGYQSDTNHQKYTANQESMHAVRSQAANLQASLTVDPSTRQQVDTLQGDHGRAIAMQSQDVMHEGGQTHHQVTQQQNKGVVHRLGERGVGEVKGMASDMKELSQDSWKSVKGESQQK